MSRYAKVCTTVYYPVSKPESGKTEEITTILKAYWKNMLDQVLPDKPDIILLPEQCDRPDGLILEKEKQKYFFERGNVMLDFFRTMARENSCYIGYSSARIHDDGRIYNSTQLIDRAGSIAGIYDKNFPAVRELRDSKIVPGTRTPIFECDFGKVGCIICWDINFPELLEEYKQKKPEIILFSSNAHSGFKSAMWAYECQSYFIGAIGGLGQWSYVLDPVGSLLTRTDVYRNPEVCKINLDNCVVMYDKKTHNAIKKKYGSKIGFHISPCIGAVMLTSETEEFTARDVAEEFEMKSFPDLIAETRILRNSTAT